MWGCGLQPEEGGLPTLGWERDIAPSGEVDTSRGVYKNKIKIEQSMWFIGEFTASAVMRYTVLICYSEERNFSLRSNLHKQREILEKQIQVAEMNFLVRVTGLAFRF